jgi:hypothetical protein
MTVSVQVEMRIWKKFKNCDKNENSLYLFNLFTVVTINSFHKPLYLTNGILGPYPFSPWADFVGKLISATIGNNLMILVGWDVHMLLFKTTAIMWKLSKLNEE